MNKKTMRIVKADYIASAVNRSSYPGLPHPQFVLLGRSNVGKSSFINAVCQRRQLARTSSAPGKTQTLNFYEINTKIMHDEDEARRSAFVLVDVPGYGYAKRAQTQKKMWAAFIQEYLVQEPRPYHLIFQLIDARHPPMDNDKDSYAWLKEKGLPVVIIANKIDKISRTLLPKNLSIIRRELKVEKDIIIPFSAVTMQGREEIYSMMLNYLDV